MNIWIALSINLVIGIDATLNLLDPPSNINYIMSGIRCAIALLSMLFSFAIYKKVMLS